MADSEELSNKLGNLKLKTGQNEVNILLLGSTGVGKSTFINAVANYCAHKTFTSAENGNLEILIPSKFNVQDSNGKNHEITVGGEKRDENETLQTGESQTQHVKTYVFPWVDANINIRLIDTPGMGDTRGIDQDNINCEDILTYISQLHELNAICFIFRSEETRVNVYFKYCITQILSRLDKSASQNLIFIFTSSRGSNYAPGETLSSLKRIVDGIREDPPNVDIPLNNNIFCFDNESFRFLAALQQKVQFTEDVKKRNIESWNKSKENWWRMIKYIVGDAKTAPLKAHMIRNTISINEVRRFIIQLSQPLAEIVQHINNNVRVLEQHERDLQIENQSLEEMKHKLYMPVLELKVTTLTQPTTVCATPKCSEIYTVCLNLNSIETI